MMKLWHDGHLTDQGQTIQRRLNFRPQAQHSVKDRTKQFTKLMCEGKVRAALRLLEGEPSGGPLPLDQCTNECTNNGSRTVLDVLKSKHPPPNRVLAVDLDPETISGQEPHPIIFDQIDSVLIRSTVHGAAGPSGLDTSCWKRMCTAFKSHSTDLCEVLPCVARSAQNTLIHLT